MTDSISKATQRPQPFWQLWVSVMAVFVIGMTVWWFVLDATWGDDDAPRLLVALGSAGLTLAFGGVAGGLLTQLFKSWEAHRVAKAAEQAFYRAILDDLKSVYDRVERAKFLIEAHKSAKTYGEQMRILPDANITLHNIRRALRPGYKDVLDDIEDHTFKCTDFIKTLTDEFRDHYKAISNAQLQDEALNKQACKELAEKEIEREDVTLANDAWQMIEKLDALQILRDDARRDTYFANFREHLDLANFHVRSRLDGGDHRQPKKQLEDFVEDRHDAAEKGTKHPATPPTP